MTIFFRTLSEKSLAGPSAARGSPTCCCPPFYGDPLGVKRTLAYRLSIGWQLWWDRTREEDATPSEISQRMNAANPKYVLRNYLAQEAIEAAHAGDDSKVRELYEVMQRPFDEQLGKEAYAKKRPEWARSKPGSSALSCSS